MLADQGALAEKSYFIRAPLITKVSPAVTPLARLKEGGFTAVVCRNLMATVFHSELEGDLSWHRYFLEQVARWKVGPALRQWAMQEGDWKVKVAFPKFLMGGVIMDVVTKEQARIAEAAGACCVMALERIPADIKKDGGVARMSDPRLIKEI